MNTVAAKVNESSTQNTYRTPLAKWARIVEIIIPAYMLGKAWGIAEPENLDLFKAQFPTFIINLTEAMKGVVKVSSVEIQRFISTTSGAVMGFLFILLLSVIMHFALRDRKFIDSMRFTAVTSLPIAVMNGIFSHALQTLLDNSNASTVEALKVEAVYTPWGYFVLNFIFYMAALWVMGRRTGVQKNRRWILLGIGVAVMAVYLAAGLMIFPGEWNDLAVSLMNK